MHTNTLTSHISPPCFSAVPQFSYAAYCPRRGASCWTAPDKSKPVLILLLIAKNSKVDRFNFGMACKKLKMESSDGHQMEGVRRMLCLRNDCWLGHGMSESHTPGHPANTPEAGPRC